MRDLVGYAQELGLDSERFREDLRKRRFASRVAEDVESADHSGVSRTPIFSINGRRHYGAYDINTLTAAVRAARVRAAVPRLPPQPRPTRKQGLPCSVRPQRQKRQ
jgi:predicted DsbA family dithiol-disulfide isomerase